MVVPPDDVATADQNNAPAEKTAPPWSARMIVPRDNARTTD
jgi:hypothetical protein